MQRESFEVKITFSYMAFLTELKQRHTIFLDASSELKNVSNVFTSSPGPKSTGLKNR